MINCNPETVSTDYDTSDKLYFEPLDFEFVKNIIDKENEDGELGSNCSIWRSNPIKNCK